MFARINHGDVFVDSHGSLVMVKGFTKDRSGQYVIYVGLKLVVDKKKTREVLKKGARSGQTIANLTTILRPVGQEPIERFRRFYERVR